MLPSKVPLAGLRVFIVDDEQDPLELAAYALERFGAKVESAMSVDEALSRIGEFAPDVVVSDVGMPHRDGYFLATAVRDRIAKGELSPMPLIALTAYTRDTDRRRARETGFSLHLGKPIDPHDLARAILTVARRDEEEGGAHGAANDRTRSDACGEE